MKLMDIIVYQEKAQEGKISQGCRFWRSFWKCNVVEHAVVSIKLCVDDCEDEENLEQ
jgi:hypothetical protein